MSTISRAIWRRWRSAWRRWSLWTALIALVVSMLVTMVWLAGRYEASQVQTRLERDAADAVSDVRVALNRNLQSLQALHASDPGLLAWEVEAAELLRLQHGGCHPEKGCRGPRPFAGARFQYLAASTIDRRSGEPILPAYAVKRFEGIPVAFIGLTLVEAPRHFIEIPAQVLRREPMVSSDDLALEQCPDALNSVGMQAEVADIFTRAVIDAMVDEVAIEAVEAHVFVGHQG